MQLTPAGPFINDHALPAVNAQNAEGQAMSPGFFA
jgi:hypothetical protein